MNLKDFFEKLKLKNNFPLLACYQDLKTGEIICSSTPRISLPIMKEIKISTINFEENINFSRELVFQFDRVFRGYAEYKQIDVVK